MSSLLDQFNSQSGQAQADPYPVMREAVKTSGYVSMMNQDVAKDPIFKKYKLNLAFPQTITHMAISNGYLVLVRTNNALYRTNLNKVEEWDGKNMEILECHSQINHCVSYRNPNGPIHPRSKDRSAVPGSNWSTPVDQFSSEFSSICSGADVHAP